MLKDSLTVLGIGVGVVFVGLISLIGIIYLMSFIVRLVRREERPIKRRKHSYDVIPESSGFDPIAHAARPALTGDRRRETVAAVSAAIAEYLGTDLSGIRIHSIRRVGGAEEPDPEARRELIAAVSAAIAEEMGTDVSGIRFISIRKAA